MVVLVVVVVVVAAAAVVVVVTVAAVGEKCAGSSNGLNSHPESCTVAG